MPTYTMNFGSFEVAGVEPVDRTTHTIELSHPEHPNVALVVFRGEVPKDKTLQDLVAARIADEMVRLSGYTILERTDAEWFGAPAIDVSSRWRNRGEVFYGRQAHMTRQDSWIAFALSAPFESRAACDGWFEQILQSFTFHG